MIVAGTGHRSGRLPGKYNENDQWQINVKEELQACFSDEKPDVVISGMALGFDTWLAELALDFNIELHCYLPFEGQEKRWKSESIQRYHSILKQASIINITSPKYNIISFQMRNELMVQHCDILLALWDGKKYGGTWNCIEYARNFYPDKDIINFWK